MEQRYSLNPFVNVWAERNISRSKKSGKGSLAVAFGFVDNPLHFWNPLIWATHTMHFKNLQMYQCGVLVSKLATQATF